MTIFCVPNCAYSKTSISAQKPRAKDIRAGSLVFPSHLSPTLPATFFTKATPELTAEGAQGSQQNSMTVD